MGPDLQMFLRAMDGEWVVDRYELDGEKVRVWYVSKANPLLEWSHTPFSFDSLPKVGTVGRIGFLSNVALGV